MKLLIKGLHCASCEQLITHELNKKFKLNTCQVSSKTGILELEGKNLKFDDISSVIKKLGYTVERDCTQNSKRGWSYYLELLLIAVIMLVIYFALSQVKMFSSIVSMDVEFNLLIALLMGVMASLSTCLAITASLVIAIGSKHANTTDNLAKKVKPQLTFHLVRLLSFTGLGMLIAYVGQYLSYSLGLSVFVNLGLSMMMMLIALKSLRLVPNSFNLTLPSQVIQKLIKLKDKQSSHLPVLLGFISFFVPCGFTQSMQLAVMSNDSVIHAGLMMLVFALGTTPVLLLVGLGSSLSRSQRSTWLQKVVGVLILLLALSLGYQSIRLLIPGSDTSNVESSQSEVQVVTMNVDYRFVPNEFTIKKGIPVRWEIYGVNITGCSNEIIIPALGLSTGRINPGLNVMEFTADQTGELDFYCWMRMLGGKFIVID